MDVKKFKSVPPFTARGARASSVVWVFRELDTLSFLTLSCPFAIFHLFSFVLAITYHRNF